MISVDESWMNGEAWGKSRYHHRTMACWWCLE